MGVKNTFSQPKCLKSNAPGIEVRNSNYNRRLRGTAGHSWCFEEEGETQWEELATPAMRWKRYRHFPYKK